MTVDGGGPKYDRSTVVPTLAEAGKTSHPGPPPRAAPPGPCAVFGLFVAAAGKMLALRMSIFLLDSLRGVRSPGVVCAGAVTPSVTAMAEAMTTREITRALKTLKFNLVSPLFEWFGRNLGSDKHRGAYLLEHSPELPEELLRP